MKTSQVGCQKVYRSTATLKGLQEFPESATMLVVYYLERQTPIFFIGLEFEVGLQDGLKNKTKQNKNNQAQLQFPKTKLPGKKNQVSRKHVGNLCQKICFGVATPKEHHTYGKAWRWQYHPVISSILYYKTLKNYKEIPISSGTSQT